MKLFNILNNYGYQIINIYLYCDQIWHWLDFPEEKLYNLGIIRDYDVYSRYRNDAGADLVAVNDNIYYFIQCKNFFVIFDEFRNLKIIIPMIEDTTDNFEKFIGEINKDVDIKMYCKEYFIIKSMMYNGNKKCITFLTTIDKSKQFENV